MSGGWRMLFVVLSSLVLLAGLGPALAQKPLEKAEAAVADEAGQQAPETGKAKAKAKPAAPEAKPATPAELPHMEHPAVQALLETKPSTPSEMLRVARSLANLQHSGKAREFLQKVLAAKLDEKQSVALAEELGPSFFTQLASREDLLPEAKQLAESVLGALDRHARNPQRLASLIKQLQAPSRDVQAQAMLQLQRARESAVEALIGVLADPARQAEYPVVRTALALMGAEAIGPLAGLLESAEARLQVEAIQTMVEMEARGSIVFLLAPFASPTTDPQVRAAAGAALQKLAGRLPEKTDAAYSLARAAQNYFDGREPLREDSPGQSRLWTWDGAKRQLIGRVYTTQDAARILAARLARQAYAILPNDDSIRLLYLVTMLEQAAVEHGLDRPLPMDPGMPGARAAAFGSQTVERVLDYGLKRNRVPAAVAAARILGQTGKAEEVLHRGAQPATLVRAARHPDARVRFVAVEAILNLKPTTPFPGCTFVTEAIGFFLASRGQRRILVADASTAEARRWAGYLAALGYQLDTATTGREVLRQATASPDYELILVDSGLEHPTVDLLLEQLRHDFRTGSIPVGVVARAGYLDRARRLAANDPLADAFPRLHAEEPLRVEVQRLLALSSRSMVSAAQRQEQAVRAIGWVADLINSASKAFDLGRLQGPLIQALEVPALGRQASGILATMGTPASQRALVDLASRASQPLELRKAALAAFQENTRKHGILLTTSEILLQYDRYNQSQHLDRATQEVLGSILDAIEAPARAAKSARQPGSLQNKTTREEKRG